MFTQWCLELEKRDINYQLSRIVDVVTSDCQPIQRLRIHETDSTAITKCTSIVLSKAVPFMVDPLGISHRLLQWSYGMILNAVSVCNPKLDEFLTEAAEKGNVLIIQNIRSELPDSLLQIVSKFMHGNDGTKTLALGGATVPIHSDFRLYLRTSRSRCLLDAAGRNVLQAGQ